MSTIKKRIPMFLLALAMMVAMALPTFAAEPRALLDVPTNTKVHITSRAYSSAYLNVENAIRKRQVIPIIECLQFGIFKC